jgi:hypothetical protein
MNLKFFNSFLLVTLFLESIQSKSVSNETKVKTNNHKTKDQEPETTLTIPYKSTESITTTTTLTTTTILTNTQPLVGALCTGPFTILGYIYLNQQAFRDFNITTITQIKLIPVRNESVMCLCANRCQQTTSCIYFEFISNSSSDKNCFVYAFNTPISTQLKNDLLRGIYYTQSGNKESCLSNILYS